MLDKNNDAFQFKEWADFFAKKESENNEEEYKNSHSNENKYQENEKTRENEHTLIIKKYLNALKAVEYYSYLIKQNNEQVNLISQSNQNLINFMTLTMNGIEQRKSQLQELMISYKDKIDFACSEFSDKNVLVPIDVYLQQQKNVSNSLLESSSSMMNSIQTFVVSFNKSVNAMYNISQQTQYQVSAITTVLDTLEQHHSSVEFKNKYSKVPNDVVVCFEEMKTKEKEAINTFNVVQNHIRTVDLISSSCKIILQQSQQIINQMKNISSQISAFYDNFLSKIKS